MERISCCHGVFLRKIGVTHRVFSRGVFEYQIFSRKSVHLKENRCIWKKNFEFQRKKSVTFKEIGNFVLSRRVFEGNRGDASRLQPRGARKRSRKAWFTRIFFECHTKSLNVTKNLWIWPIIKMHLVSEGLSASLISNNCSDDELLRVPPVSFVRW